MNAAEQIIARQVEWARNNDLELIGSAGARGQRVYTVRPSDNLFGAMNDETKKELEAGDGGELTSGKGRPAKIQALHSSAALGINVFDYWRGVSDLSVVTSACALSSASSEVIGRLQFEQKVPIDDRFQYSPNIDVLITTQTKKYAAYAIECKFTEAYSTRTHGGMDTKYFDNVDIWDRLPGTMRLAKEISPDDNRFRHLHAAQLIKHILGLNRRFGLGRYRLMYLWYDAFGEAGFVHRTEVQDFARVVREDGVVFHEATYQEVILRLATTCREGHPAYIQYLTKRYL